MRGAEEFDIVIVGAGVAGASLAYFLAERGVTDVLVLEREPSPAFHASGRSARTLLELDPNPTVQRLKVHGAEFFRQPPAELARAPLLERRGAMRLFRGVAWQELQARTPKLMAAGLNVALLTAAQATELVPVLDDQEFDGAAFLPDDGFIDVDALMAGFVRVATAAGVTYRYAVEVLGVRSDAGRCRGLVTGAGDISARFVVNAAGAWAGSLGAMAGALSLALTPLRRSIATYPVPEGLDVGRWPLVWSDDHAVYFRPGFEGLMLCPMDEARVAPCDAKPDPAVFAAAVERLRRLAPAVVPERLSRTWAGLRTFAADGIPVVGEDPLVAGFFWLAGQGGCGIETSPVLAEVAADLLLAGRTERFDADLLSPSRFAAPT